jgi:hypothetical protein
MLITTSLERTGREEALATFLDNCLTASY